MDNRQTRHTDHTFSFKRERRARVIRVDGRVKDRRLGI